MPQTQLPPDYIELEKRVDALKKVHTSMLQVTYVIPSAMDPPSNRRSRSQYSNEAYDYPANIRESVTDLSRTVTEKVNLLSNATSPAEAQAALTAPPSTKPQPKTFSHAVARTALNASHLLTSEQTSSSEDPLATALEKYALASEKVGEARLNQDAQIQSRFLAGWSTTLNTNIQFATRARKNVENARLGLDATKASARGNAFSLPGQAGRKDGLEEDLSEEARAKIEQAEDEFVGQTEEAVGVMKNVSLNMPVSVSIATNTRQVLDTPEPLRNLTDLIAAQLEYHKRAYEILSELAPVVDQLQVEQEVRRHQSSDF
jgi:hypothetical protein